MDDSRQSNDDRVDYDAVIVGASLAGCATAIALGRGGARVALVEKRPDPAAFKRICSHFIQASAVPALDRLDLLEPIIEAGGVRSAMRAWTPWGWIEAPPSGTREAVNLRRELLDPLLREGAAATPGVELMLGRSAERLVRENDAVCGVVVRAPDGAGDDAAGQARRRRRRPRLPNRRAGRGEDQDLAARALRLRRLLRWPAGRCRWRQLDLDARPATGRPPSPPTVDSSSTRRCRPRTVCPSFAATPRAHCSPSSAACRRHRRSPSRAWSARCWERSRCRTKCECRSRPAWPWSATRRWRSTHSSGSAAAGPCSRASGSPPASRRPWPARSRCRPACRATGAGTGAPCAATSR